ncbi:MAG TPA: DUF3105 domain-containing protein [Egibacteraceae bacterium]|nr:DUF3105 domain-containing protein [Egibacteraceae bacterium]
MSEERLSKRERQKRRREAKLAEQRAAEARSRRVRLLIFALIGVVFAGLVGAAVVNQRAQRAELAAREAQTQARLDDLGCTEDEQMEDRGQGHLDGQTLAQRPPEAIYPDRPATSGEHHNNWFITGTYDQLLDERVLVHNLEHGYVVVYYTEGADADQVADLKAAAEEHIEGPYKKVIVAPWDGELADGANFAYTAWTQRQLCEQYDPDVFELFLRNHHSGAGDAPEKHLPPHLTPQDGIDPGDEPFLLPPLGEERAPEGMEEDGTIPTDGATEAEETTS